MDPLKKGLKAYQKTAGAPKVADAAKTAPSPAPAKAPLSKAPLIKETSSAAAKHPGPKGLGGEKNIRKVAKFLILLGKEEASKVVRHLSPAEIKELSQEIASIQQLEPSEAEKILEDFGYISSRLPGSLQGGTEVAQSILDLAFGAEKAKSVLRKAVPGAFPKPFEFLQDLELGALVTLLKGESLMILSLVLPHLSKANAAKILMSVPQDQQKSLIMRMAKMTPVGKEVVDQVEKALKEKIRHTGNLITEDIDGQSRLAEILRHMNLGQENSLLNQLEKTSPVLAQTLRERLFTQETILKISDDSLEDLLRSYDEGQLALLLLGASPNLQTKIKANISSRRLVLVQEEQDILGTTSPTEIQKALKEFLELCRSRVREGSLVLMDETEEYL